MLQYCNVTILQMSMERQNSINVIILRGENTSELAGAISKTNTYCSPNLHRQSEKTSNSQRYLVGDRHDRAMGAMCIMSRYPKFNGNLFGLPPSSFYKMTGLGGKKVWRITYSTVGCRRTGIRWSQPGSFLFSRLRPISFLFFNLSSSHVG